MFSIFIFQCSFFDYRNEKIVFRRYACLYFIAGVTEDEVKRLYLAYLTELASSKYVYCNEICISSL
jgi:hypothetical protein